MAIFVAEYLKVFVKETPYFLSSKNGFFSEECRRKQYIRYTVFVSVSFSICKPEAVMNVSRKSQEIILQKILTFQTRKPLIDTLKDCKINNFSNVLKRPKD